MWELFSIFAARVYATQFTSQHLDRQFGKKQTPRRTPWFALLYCHVLSTGYEETAEQLRTTFSQKTHNVSDTRHGFPIALGKPADEAGLRSARDPQPLLAHGAVVEVVVEHEDLPRGRFSAANCQLILKTLAELSTSEDY